MWTCTFNQYTTHTPSYIALHKMGTPPLINQGTNTEPSPTVCSTISSNGCHSAAQGPSIVAIHSCLWPSCKAANCYCFDVGFSSIHSTMPNCALKDCTVQCLLFSIERYVHICMYVCMYVYTNSSIVSRVYTTILLLFPAVGGHPLNTDRLFHGWLGCALEKHLGLSNSID